MSTTLEQASRSIGCPACRDPARFSRHRVRLGCSVIEARRDQEAELYRASLSERDVAAQLGVSMTTVHFDLVARGVTMRPQTAGLKRGLATPEDLQALQEGNGRYRAEVERVKAERGLIDRDELVERLRRAGVPRSKPAIVGYVSAGLIEPVRGLGFDKPWLFTEASATELVTRLRDYPDGRMRRFDDVKWRGAWIRRRHGLRAARRAWGRTSKARSAARGTKMGRPRGMKLAPDKVALIRDMARRGKTPGAIAIKTGVSRSTVRRVLES